MAGLPVHPRLSAMILKAKEIGQGAQACDLAAFLEERDSSAGRDEAEIDLASRRHGLATSRNDAGARVLEQARRLRRLAGIKDEIPGGEETPGILLALAYPERVARRRAGDANRYTMVSGTIAVVPAGSPLARQEYLAIGEVDGVGAEVRVLPRPWIGKPFNGFLEIALSSKKRFGGIRGMVLLSPGRWNDGGTWCLASGLSTAAMIGLPGCLRKECGNSAWNRFPGRRKAAPSRNGANGSRREGSSAPVGRI